MDSFDQFNQNPMNQEQPEQPETAQPVPTDQTMQNHGVNPDGERCAAQQDSQFQNGGSQNVPHGAECGGWQAPYSDSPSQPAAQTYANPGSTASTGSTAQPYFAPQACQGGNAPAAGRSKPKKERNKHMGLRVAALALACALLGSIGGGTLVGVLLRSSEQNTQVEQPKDEKEESQSLPETNEEFQASMTSNSSENYMTPAQIYSNYVDAVVGITNESITNTYGQISSTASSGSGFIVTEDGYIVSNYHVVEDADTLTVTLHNGESYEAELVGSDSINDVALLKIDASGLTVAPLGDSDTLSVGDAVAAIGNPLGELDFSMTVGYISALSRVINTDGKPINMMQTDTAINPGNSGGPLFDMHGNVVGITTAKYSGSTTSGASIEGLGFAIPINDVKAIISDLQQYGYVTGQPYIGITIGDIDSAYVTYYNYPTSAYVDSVEAGSCGEKAGLKQGDLITALGEEKIECYTDLVVALKQYAAGDTTTITVYRNGQEQTLTITFDERRPQEEQTVEEEEETMPDFGGFGNIFP